MASAREPESGLGGKSDYDLLRLTVQQDEAAFAELYERFKARVINLAYRFLGHKDDAELIAQDVFIKVWEHAGKFRARPRCGLGSTASRSTGA